MDIVPEEIRQRTIEAGVLAENIRYKDHKLAKIEIAPALYQGMPKNRVPLQEADAISTVSLGIIRGNVKPSNLTDGGALSQTTPHSPPSRSNLIHVRRAVNRISV